MTRRQIISLAGYCAWSSRAYAAVRPVRSFAISSPPETLLYLQGFRSNLYCLLHNGSTPLFRSVGPDARVNRSYELPSEYRHAWFGIRSTGEPLFATWKKGASGISFEERSGPQGAVTREITDRPGAVGAISYAVCQDTLAALRRDFSLELFPLGERTPVWRRLVSSAASTRGARLYSSNASDAQVVAIDETIATGSSIDIRTGTLSQITLACAEIEAAKKYYAGKASSTPPDGTPRFFVIVASMCVAEDGSLWAIILPSDVRIGLNIAHFDHTGKHITSMLCEVPFGKKPIGLTVMGRTLFLGLSDGELLVYPV